MSLKFTPPVEQDKYALSIGSFFRTYKELGAAKLAYHSHAYGSGYVAHILERVGNEWYILYTVDATKERVSYVELPWVKKVKSYNYYGDRHIAAPMTREEYAKWRLRVEFERMFEMNEDQLVDHVEANYYAPTQAKADPSPALVALSWVE